MQFYHNELDEISKEALATRLNGQVLENESRDNSENNEDPIERSFKYFPQKIEEAAKKKVNVGSAEEIERAALDIAKSVIKTESGKKRKEAGITGIDPHKKEDDPGGIMAGYRKQREIDVAAALGTPAERAKRTAQELSSRIESRGGTTDYLSGIAGTKKQETPTTQSTETPSTSEKSIYQRQREIASQLMKKRSGQETVSPSAASDSADKQTTKSDFQIQREKAAELMKKRIGQKATTAAPEAPTAEEPVRNKVETPSETKIVEPLSNKPSFKDFLKRAGEKVRSGIENVGDDIYSTYHAWKGFPKEMKDELKSIWFTKSDNEDQKKK